MADMSKENKIMTEQQICDKLQTVLKPGRYRHTLGVADTAQRLAAAWNISTDKARLAGLLHDCGKEAGDALSHGPIGAKLARTEYGVEDEEILSAIACHTTGKPDMSTLDKIIFIADYIEPGRDQAPHLDELRTLAYQDLDRTLLRILEDTFDYLKASGKDIDSRSLDTYHYYLHSYNCEKKNSEKETKPMEESKLMIETAYKALTEKKAAEVTVIDIHDVSTIADYFIITNGENSPHVQALVENVQEQMYKAGFACKSVEGFRSANWVLLDYGDIVVNVFSKEDRRFYDLERIWRDGKVITDISEL